MSEYGKKDADVGDLDTQALRRRVLTSDGMSVAAKEEALEELIERGRAFRLVNQDTDKDTGLTVKAFGSGCLLLQVDGYGDKCSPDRLGIPVLLEVWGGELRLIVWSDINQEDPTHTISLEGARCNRREDS